MVLPRSDRREANLLVADGSGDLGNEVERNPPNGVRGFGRPNGEATCITGPAQPLHWERRLDSGPSRGRSDGSLSRARSAKAPKTMGRTGAVTVATNLRRVATSKGHTGNLMVTSYTFCRHSILSTWSLYASGAPSSWAKAASISLSNWFETCIMNPFLTSSMAV